MILCSACGNYLHVAAEAEQATIVMEDGEAIRTVDTDARFRHLVREHIEFVWRCMRRLGVPSPDCDDATQQVLYIAFSKLSSIAEGSERSFLFATAHRLASNIRRGANRRDAAEKGLDGLEPDQPPSPEDLSDQLRARSLLDTVLEEMTPDLRAVFVLFELEEMPITDIATMLDLPRGTANSRLRRAREAFREKVTRLKAAGAFRGLEK